jgi:hypothetical protein
MTVDRKVFKAWIALAFIAFCSTVAAEDAQWVRVTVLLEPAEAGTFRPQNTLVPGGVYSLAEVNRRGQAAIDREILERVRHLSQSIQGAEESMRLATLLARQYYLELEVGQQAVLPAVDLNPRLSVVFEPERFVGNQVVCKVQFLEPEGPLGTPDFVGEPITLRLQEANLRDVLNAFSRIVPMEIVVDPSIQGTVTVDLRDVPWDQAFDAILRTNGLGWSRDDGTIRVEPPEKSSSRKRVRTEATLKLPRSSWSSSMIASRGDEYNPTMVLVVESVDGPPEMAAERDGLVHPRQVQTISSSPGDLGDLSKKLVIFRARLNTDGEVKDAEILASPSPALSEHLLKALEQWRFRFVLDEAGRKQEAVVGYGVRLSASSIPSEPFQEAVKHIGIEMEVDPPPPEMAADHPDLFVVSTYVRDLDTGEVISAPRILVRKGEEATVSSTIPGPEGAVSLFKMKILVSEDENNVSYSWTITSSGTVVASNSAEFKL